MAAFYNRASLSYNGNTTLSNLTVGDLQTTLTVTKTPVNPTYTSGDTATYIISLTNSGATPFTNLTVTDNLGAYTFGSQTLTPITYLEGTLYYYQNGTLQTTPTITEGPPLVVSGITVPAGGNATVIYQGTLTYTFTIQNYADTPATAGDAVVLSDTFNPVLSGISVTNNGASWPASNYNYNGTTGVFTTVSGAITVPAATFTQDATTGVWTTTPGTTVIAVTGTV